MQNGQSNGRSNGIGRAHHHSHHGHGHHPGIKNRDLKLNIGNNLSIIDNSVSKGTNLSMLRSEEKERQRQEARALRERTRVGAAPPPEPKEALFAVVQRSPQNSDQDRRITEILGDFSEVSKRYKPSEHIAADHPTPTPTPTPTAAAGSSVSAATAAHPLDPNIYAPPTTTYTPRKPPEFNAYHRSHGGSGVPRSSKPPGPLHKPSHHHPKFVEEVKPSLKSGPGPGPGPGSGSRPHHQERVLTSGLVGGGPGRGRPRSSNEKIVKDPQVQRIMNEMSDLKSPLSAISQTPRPDHQSSFTFPNPATTPPVAARDLPPSGFRLPHDTHLKSGKASESRSSVIPPKALESNLNDEFELSEESEEEMVSGPRVPETTDGGPGANPISRQSLLLPLMGGDTEGLLREPPVSPIKNTDESSNSEESSCTDSESSTSEEEGKQSPPTSPPTSPMPYDSTNPWSLESIFQQNTNNKDDEPIVPEGGVNNFPNHSKDIAPEPMLDSPFTVTEPAPPVVTTVPYMHHPKPPPGSTKTLGSPTTDESSDELTPKAHQKAMGSRASSRASSRAGSRAGSRTSYGRTKPQHQHPTPTKIKKIIEPDLSSDSDDDDHVPQKPRISLKSHSISKSPKALIPLSLPKGRNTPVNKASKKREAKKEAGPPLAPAELKKSMEAVLSERDSDCVSDRALATHEKSSPKKGAGGSASAAAAALLKASAPSSSSSSSSRLHSSKKSLAGDHSAPTQRSPRKLNLTSPSSSSMDGSHHVKHLYKDAKHNGEAKRSVSKERDVREARRPTKDASQPPPPPPHQDAPPPPLLKREDAKPEKRRRRTRRESDAEAKGKRSDRESNWEDGGGVSSGSHAHQRLEEGNGGRLSASPAARKFHSASSSNRGSLPHVQYENGVPKIFCSIPLYLIDKLPNNSTKGGIKEEEVNKEVLEMRTSGGKGVIKKEVSGNCGTSNKSPPNEDETKLRAIRSIYRKMETSVEPEKVKRDSQEAKSPALTLKVEEAPVKQEMKSRSSSRHEGKGGSSKASPEASLKRHGSSSSLSSMGTVASSSSRSHSHSKKHKKDKRKDKEQSSSRKEEKEKLKEKGLEVDTSAKRKKRAVSPEPELPMKRTRGSDTSRESSRVASSGKAAAATGVIVNPPKKLLLAAPHEEETHVVSPNESARDSRLSPHPLPHPHPHPNPYLPQTLLHPLQATQLRSQPTPNPYLHSQHPHPHPQQYSHPTSSSHLQPNPPQQPPPPHPHPNSHSHLHPLQHPHPHTNPHPHPHPHPHPLSHPHLHSHLRSSQQRSLNEEHSVLSSLANEAPHAPYQPRMKQLPQQQQQQQQQQQPQSASSQDKAVEEHQSVASGVDISEDHSLPSSEHGSATYRNEERISPSLGLVAASQQHLDLTGCGLMYPPNTNPSPGTSTEYNNPLVINQDATDNTQFLERAKELKHQADSELHRILRTVKYLESVLYFILYGESMECDRNSFRQALTIYTETVRLIRYVSSPIFKTQNRMDKSFKDDDSRLSIILAILSLRCQSLLSLKVYTMQLRNFHNLTETQQFLTDYFKGNTLGRQLPPSATPSATPSASSSNSSGEGTPSGAPTMNTWGGSQRAAANNSPSSLSPTPSPADSVGSEGSLSSGYSTEGARQQRGQHPAMGATPPQVPPMVSVPADIFSYMSNYYSLSINLTHAYNTWSEADDFVRRYEIKDFFTEVERTRGSLTFHSSLKHLVWYVYQALDKLKKLI